MSSLKVEIVKIDEIIKHPNADRLEIAQIKGWQSIVSKGEFFRGDLVVYFPIDSVLPQSLEAKIFTPDSKIRLSNHRVKTIKLRGAISQGLIVEGETIGVDVNHLSIGSDVTNFLKVTKYEPPEDFSSQLHTNRIPNKQSNPNFRKYTDIENWKNYRTIFEPGEKVFVLEKIHGTNFRAGWVPFHVNTWWKRLKQFFNLTPNWEFVYGSHNVQLQYSHSATRINVYLEAVDKYQLRQRLKPGEVIYGEIYGDGIQKGYIYDCQPNERKLAVFDVRVNDKYINHINVILFCTDLKLQVVPLDGNMDYDADRIQKLVNAPSWLGKKVREGVVIKPEIEQACFIGRKILKYKNDDFLLGVNDDTH